MAYCAYTRPENARVSWSPDFSTVALDGGIILIEDVQRGIRSLVEDAEDAFYTVVRQVEVDDFEGMVDKLLDVQDIDNHIHDDLRKRTLGYFFAIDPRNPFSDMLDAPLLLQRFIQRDCRLAVSEFHVRDPGNADRVPRWNQDAILRWFSDVGSFVQVYLYLSFFWLTKLTLFAVETHGRWPSDMWGCESGHGIRQLQAVQRHAQRAELDVP